MKIFLLILGIISFSPLVQQRSTPANEKDLKRQRQQARAIALIEQVGSEAELWDDKRSAVEALANAADLLWDRNPSRSSKWLRKAWDLVDQVTESEQNPALKEFVRQSDKAQLKSIVLRVAHSHDPKLADKFVQQIAEEQPEQKKERGAFDDRTARSEPLDRDQGLVALEQSLQAMNKLDHFDLKNSSAPKLGIKGSWRSESLADIPRIGFSFRSAIEPLIATEFENLVNLTDTLKVREFRGLAQLEIARLFLEKQKP